MQMATTSSLRGIYFREQEVLDEERKVDVVLNTMNNECRTGIFFFLFFLSGA